MLNTINETSVSTCLLYKPSSIINKEGQIANYNSTAEAIQKGLSIPVFTDYYMQLNQIDFNMGNIMLPVNKALKMALEEVLQYYTYRPFPNKKTA